MPEDSPICFARRRLHGGRFSVLLHEISRTSTHSVVLCIFLQAICVEHVLARVLQSWCTEEVRILSALWEEIMRH